MTNLPLLDALAESLFAQSENKGLAIPHARMALIRRRIYVDRIYRNNVRAYLAGRKIFMWFNK